MDDNNNIVLLLFYVISISWIKIVTLLMFWFILIYSSSIVTDIKPLSNNNRICTINSIEQQLGVNIFYKITSEITGTLTSSCLTDNPIQTLLVQYLSIIFLVHVCYDLLVVAPRRFIFTRRLNKSVKNTNIRLHVGQCVFQASSLWKINAS